MVVLNATFDIGGEQKVDWKWYSWVGQAMQFPRFEGFSPNSVSTLWGSYGKGKEWCPWGVLPQPRLSTAQARTEFRLRRQCRTEWLPRDFGSFYRVPVHFLTQNVVLRDRCRRSDGFGGSKRDFTWQVQGIGHFVKIVAGAVVCGRCQNVGRRVSFEGLRFTWQAQGIRTMDAMFKSRCKIRPGASPEAAKIVFFFSVPAAAFDIEDHPSTGLRSKSCSGTNRLFFSGSGRNVWHWRSLQRRSKNGLLQLARPCCFAVLEAAFGKPCLFYRFRPQRLTLKITSAQVSEVSPAAAQIVSFLAVPAATFDTEDHPSTGRKTVSLSSPDHAVSLFRRQPFWEGFWVRSRCFAGRDIQTQPKVPTVYFEGNWRCKLHPEAAKPPFFIDSGRDVWHWRSPNAGWKTVSLSSPGHAVSLFRRQPFWEGFWVRSRGFARCDAQTQPKVPTVYFEGNWRCKLRPTAAKTFFFF